MDSPALSAPARVSQADLARLLNVSRQSINELVGRGILVLGDDDKLDFEDSKQRLASSLHPGSKTAQALAPLMPAAPSAPATVSAPSSTPAPMSYQTAKTLREVSEAAMAQLELRKMQGELVEVAAVRTAMGGKVAALREALLQIPSRLTPVLAAETDPKKIYAALDAELRTALQFVSTPTTEETENGQ
jgi:hypothetical protein